MKNKAQQVLQAAVMKLLYPLVKILLRNGLSFGNFCDLAKRVYVDVAMHEGELPGRKMSNTRIAILTGLTRNEVKRVIDLPEVTSGEVSKRYNRAARVLSGWARDPAFSNQEGKVADLPFDGEEASFVELVKKYSGTIHPKTILDELERVQCLKILDNGYIRLLTHGYSPRGSETEKLDIMGTDTADLLFTFDQNINPDNQLKYLQRKVCYDALPLKALPKLREVIKTKGRNFLEDLDQLLSSYDLDVNPSKEKSEKKRAGVGIYYFED